MEVVKKNIKYFISTFSIVMALFIGLKIPYSTLLEKITMYLPNQQVNEEQVKPTKTYIVENKTSLDDFIIFKAVNDYRDEKGLNRVRLDDVSCDIAERIIDKDWWQKQYNIEEYYDICPKCSDLKVNLAEDSTNDGLILHRWKADKDTNNNLISYSNYGCVRVQNNKVALVLTTKTKAGNTYINNSDNLNKNTITCTGPDGKTFQTSQEECDNFNAAWENVSIRDIPTKIEQKQQKPSTKLDYYCYDNTYDNWYYTSSGEQCNKDNADSALYDLCSYNTTSFGEYKECQDSCSNDDLQNSDICYAAYGDEDAYLEYNWDLFIQCSDEATDEFISCLDSCSPLYQKVLNECMGN